MLVFVGSVVWRVLGIEWPDLLVSSSSSSLLELSLPLSSGRRKYDLGILSRVPSLVS